MAAYFVIFGSLLGFVGGLTAFLALDAGVVTALSIWALSGPFSVLALIILRGLKAPAPAQDNARPA